VVIPASAHSIAELARNAGGLSHVRRIS